MRAAIMLRVASRYHTEEQTESLLLIQSILKQLTREVTENPLVASQCERNVTVDF